MIDLDRRSLHVATDPRGLQVKGHRRETETRSGQAMPKPKAEPARFLLWTRHGNQAPAKVQRLLEIQRG